MEVGDVLEVGDIKEMESTGLGLSWFWGEKKRELGRFLSLVSVVGTWMGGRSIHQGHESWGEGGVWKMKGDQTQEKALERHLRDREGGQ